MALITCPECGNKLSDRAEECPHCGYPVENILQEPLVYPTDNSNENNQNDTDDNSQNKKRRTMIFIAVAALVILAGAGLYFFTPLFKANPNKPVEITAKFISAVRSYDEVGQFSEGLAPVRRGNKWGYIDTSGTEVIPCQYAQKGGTFVGGYALADSAYINTKGQRKNLSKQEIKNLKSLAKDENTLVKFKENGKWGYKDKDGKVVVKPKYHGLGSFHNGVALAVLTNAETTVEGDEFHYATRMQDWADDGSEDAQKMHDIYDEVFIYGYVDAKGKDTFKAEDFSKIEEKISKRAEEDQRLKEENERIQREGPDWLQGTWRVEMKDDYGNFIGYIYSTFDHGKLTMTSGEMTLDFTYVLGNEGSTIEFGEHGKFYINHQTVLTNDGKEMEKVSGLTSGSSSSTSYSYSGSGYSSSSSSQRDQELEIMNQLHELGEKGKRMMPRIEQLYRRQQQAQRQGILSNPNAQFDLNDAIGKLIDIKNEQIRLAERLGDAQLVKEYKDQRNAIYRAKDQMLYGVR